MRNDRQQKDMYVIAETGTFALLMENVSQITSPVKHSHDSIRNYK